jgi:hypothetical protein
MAAVFKSLPPLWRQIRLLCLGYLVKLKYSSRFLLAKNKKYAQNHGKNF